MSKYQAKMSREQRDLIIGMKHDDFIKAVDSIWNNESLPKLTREIMIVQLLHVTYHKEASGKLQYLSSISTSPIDNKYCLSRHNMPGSVCAHCFGFALVNRYDNTQVCALNNGYILKNFDISETAWAVLAIPTLYCRIEAIGDIENETQARNYTRIIKTHPAINFGIWSKNGGIWWRVFEEIGKPKNTTYVHTSTMLNDVDMRYVVKNIAFVDHIFTVYDKSRSNVVINCGGEKCFSCLRCYKRLPDNFDEADFFVNEQLK